MMWAYLCVVVHVYLQCELKTVTYSIPAVYSSGHKKVYVFYYAVGVPRLYNVTVHGRAVTVTF